MYNVTNVSSTNTSVTSAVKCLIETPLAPSQSGSSFSEATTDVSTVLAITVNVLTMPMTLFLNALIMFVVWKNPSLQVERVIVLAYLALADFLLVLICQPLYIARQILHLESYQVNCSLETAFFLSSGLLKGIEFYQLAVISYERYIAIIHPYQYPTRITAQRLTYAAIGLWTFNTGVCLLIFLRLVFNITLYTSFLILILKIATSVCIVYWYVKIYAAIRRQKRQISQQLRNINMNHSQTNLRNYKGTMTTGLLLGCFVVSYIPFFAVFIASQIPGLIPKDNLIRISIKQWIETSMFVIALLNPIIYGLRTKQLKKKCWGVLGFQNTSDEDFSHNAFVLQPVTRKEGSLDNNHTA